MAKSLSSGNIFYSRIYVCRFVDLPASEWAGLSTGRDKLNLIRVMTLESTLVASEWYLCKDIFGKNTAAMVEYYGFVESFRMMSLTFEMHLRIQNH